MSLFRRRKPDLPTMITDPPERMVKYSARMPLVDQDIFYVFPADVTREEKLMYVRTSILLANQIVEQIEDEV